MFGGWKGTSLLKLHLNAADYGIVVAYFLVILLIGLRLRRRNNTSQQFFEAGRSLPLAITGIAFVAANCGSLEVMERYYPHGLLGLGVTAVLASFMSGMAGVSRS